MIEGVDHQPEEYVERAKQEQKNVEQSQEAVNRTGAEWAKKGLEQTKRQQGWVEGAAKEYATENVDKLTAEAKAEAEAAGKEINLPTAPGDTPETPPAPTT